MGCILPPGPLLALALAFAFALARAGADAKQLSFETKVRQSEKQTIEIENTTDSKWVLVPDFQVCCRRQSMMPT